MSAYTKEIAIAGIVILEGIALWKGIDGACLSTVIGVLGSVLGFSFKVYIDERRSNK